jgi:hypothetical protein
MSHNDKVWHKGLLYKIKNNFRNSHDFYVVIKSYLLHRMFRVKYEGIVTRLKEINFSRVPQAY